METWWKNISYKLIELSIQHTLINGCVIGVNKRWEELDGSYKYPEHTAHPLPTMSGTKLKLQNPIFTLLANNVNQLCSVRVEFAIRVLRAVLEWLLEIFIYRLRGFRL